MSDQGSHFINRTIIMMTEEFKIQHKKSTPYHPQVNGMVKAFNKVLEHALTKVCNTNRDDWDLKIPIALWAYHTTCKRLRGNTPFNLVYGKEEIMPMEYIVLIFCIAVATWMDDEGALEERLAPLVQLQEDWFVTGFHQRVQKDRQKVWYYRHVKKNHFHQGNLMLIYDSNFEKHPCKFQMHWLAPYVINFITEGGAV